MKKTITLFSFVLFLLCHTATVSAQGYIDVNLKSGKSQRFNLTNFIELLPTKYDTENQYHSDFVAMLVRMTDATYRFLMKDINCILFNNDKTPAITNIELLSDEYNEWGILDFSTFKEFNYCFELRITANINSVDDVDEWGFCIVDSTGNRKHIRTFRMKGENTERVEFYSNERKNEIRICNYIKYDGENDYRYTEEIPYTLEYVLSSCPDENHPHLIDMGLESGTKWYCCNAGAASPTDRGDYYAWGENHSKSDFSVENYEHKTQNKNGYYECAFLSTCISGMKEYDGSPFGSMPTKEQASEFHYGCTKKDAPGGTIWVSKVNNQRLFLPKTGYYYASDTYEEPRHEIIYEESGFYWTGSRYSETMGTDTYYGSPAAFHDYSTLSGNPTNQFCGLCIRSVDRVAHPQSNNHWW